ncbi:hypothetical protein Purlil1_12440 [Purpureocillium lilacinum]|uniref:Prion-inhibition and propagation HeLo domain-containing protein n=1 Tax=Purpureocillium lilacinum TaxID=33203 RepID=A0ABR0BH36_PURLI|nr:hypothetical protein Purlil1_12440 [Purpureocillium lilacinum]
MEAAGLVIGVAGLAGLFNSCLEAVDKVQSYQTFGADSHVLDTRLRLAASGSGVLRPRPDVAGVGTSDIVGVLIQPGQPASRSLAGAELPASRSNGVQDSRTPPALLKQQNRLSAPLSAVAFVIAVPLGRHGATLVLSSPFVLHGSRARQGGSMRLSPVPLFEDVGSQVQGSGNGVADGEYTRVSS